MNKLIGYLNSKSRKFLRFYQQASGTVGKVYSQQKMKTIQSLIPGTLASLATFPPSENEPPILSGVSRRPDVQNECETVWQKKWLKLDVVHPMIQELASEAEKFCSNWFFNRTGKTLLVIVGNFGSGKTHTAKAIHKFCVSAATRAFDSKKWGEVKIPSAVFISWPVAASAFNEKQFGLMEDANENDLVILDDIGAENDPWKICADKLCQILSRRERKFTVITTNIKPENWTERFDGRINDRLLRNSSIVDISEAPPYSMRD